MGADAIEKDKILHVRREIGFGLAIYSEFREFQLKTSMYVCRPSLSLFVFSNNCQ